MERQMDTIGPNIGIKRGGSNTNKPAPYSIATECYVQESSGEPDSKISFKHDTDRPDEVVINITNLEGTVNTGYIKVDKEVLLGAFGRFKHQLNGRD